MDLLASSQADYELFRLTEEATRKENSIVVAQLLQDASEIKADTDGLEIEDVDRAIEAINLDLEDYPDTIMLYPTQKAEFEKAGKLVPNYPTRDDIISGRQWDRGPIFGTLHSRIPLQVFSSAAVGAGNALVYARRDALLKRSKPKVFFDDAANPTALYVRYQVRAWFCNVKAAEKILYREP